MKSLLKSTASSGEDLLSSEPDAATHRPRLAVVLQKRWAARPVLLFRCSSPDSAESFTATAAAMKTNATPPNSSSPQASLFTRLGLAWLLVLSVLAPAHGANTFANTGSLVNARTQHTATLLPNGRCSSRGYNGTSYRRAWSFTIRPPANGAQPVSLATARTQHTATLLPNGKVLVLGGFECQLCRQRGDLRSGHWRLGGTGARDRAFSTHRDAADRWQAARRRGLERNQQ
jgi:hypothetical protein